MFFSRKLFDKKEDPVPTDEKRDNPVPYIIHRNDIE